MEASFVIIGGGISGVTCAEQVYALAPQESVVLITASPVVKTVSNVSRLTRHLEAFDVSEKPLACLEQKLTNLTVVRGFAHEIDVDAKIVRLVNGAEVRYKRLCVTTGGQARMVAQHPLVLGIRDTESVRVLQGKLRGARRVMIIGNGGIATELVYELEGLEIVWAIKHSSISATFVDPGAAEFFLSRLEGKRKGKEEGEEDDDDGGGGVQDRKPEGGACGSALGPDWHHDMLLSSGEGHSSRKVVILEKECWLDRLLSPEEAKGEETTGDWPVFVKLSNGKVYGVDFVVSATGVEPVVPKVVSGQSMALAMAPDGGILVDDRLRSSVTHVFAAGDACTPNWPLAKHWFQMRLWSQARTMGAYVGRSMLADLKQDEGEDDALMEFAFEIFAHVTQFYGYKTVFLGLFNGQGLGTDYEILLRVTKGREYVKTVMQDGKMQGALLIGDTGLEETFENLILNQLDLSVYGEDLLDPGIDIEDYFD
ncbi:unnamed protein product [Notodromas monacha]|uniref:Pyridine nucleotide-disulfide oxidoreductase domain-containing protein 1 n=1 Tax=Notodromas monacha TaxID=399045 RepID=A0A7R9BBV0_9CRUS|nr:unnamed protein product [Notodromas monacha]CAG0912432.1 unnamed protein product [Notodromas monacha]